MRKDGFEEDDILLFNGDFNDAMTKEIYRAWQVKNFGKTNYGRSVEYKHAIVDYFKELRNNFQKCSAGWCYAESAKSESSRDFHRNAAHHLCVSVRSEVF